MSQEGTIALIFSIAIAGGVLVVVSALRHRAKIIEMAHRERLAMIERGLVPPSELPASPAQETRHRRAQRSSRLLSAGIVIVGFGLGLATLIAFASGAPSVAVGLGGAVAIVGGALIVTALVVHRDPDTPRDS
jgi:hypothetical protein